MQLSEMRLVTVIAPDDLESRLIGELKTLGATGYTVSHARGEGSHGVRTSELEGANIRLEVIVDPPTAQRVVERVMERFQPQYGIVLYVSTIEVVRGAKFTGGAGSNR